MEGFSAGLVDDRCSCSPLSSTGGLCRRQIQNLLAQPARPQILFSNDPWHFLTPPASDPCSNLFEWAVTVLGPPDTLYEGGFFNAGDWALPANCTCSCAQLPLLLQGGKSLFWSCRKSLYGTPLLSFEKVHASPTPHVLSSFMPP